MTKKSIKNGIRSKIYAQIQSHHHNLSPKWPIWIMAVSLFLWFLTFFDFLHVLLITIDFFNNFADLDFFTLLFSTIFLIFCTRYLPKDFTGTTTIHHPKDQHGSWWSVFSLIFLTNFVFFAFFEQILSNLLQRFFPSNYDDKIAIHRLIIMIFQFYACIHPSIRWTTNSTFDISSIFHKIFTTIVCGITKLKFK